MAVKSTCKIAFVVYVITVVVFIVSFGAPFWLWKSDTIDGETVQAYTGLWVSCYGRDSSSECESITGDIPDWFWDCRKLMIAALVVNVAAGFTHMYMPVTGWLQILGGLLTTSATLVFGIKMADLYSDDGMTVPLHWAFGLAVIAGIMFLVNGIVLVARARCDMTRNVPCESTRPHDIQLETPSVYVVSQPPPYVEQPPTYAGVYERDDTMLVP